MNFQVRLVHQTFDMKAMFRIEVLTDNWKHSELFQIVICWLSLFQKLVAGVPLVIKVSALSMSLVEELAFGFGGFSTLVSFKGRMRRRLVQYTSWNTAEQKKSSLNPISLETNILPVFDIHKPAFGIPRYPNAHFEHHYFFI